MACIIPPAYQLGYKIKVETISNQDIRERVDVREIYRYLGYGRAMPDDDVTGMVSGVLDSLVGAVKPKNIYRVYECGTDGANVLLDGRVFCRSSNLADNLAQCGSVVLFAATLGIEADKLLQRFEVKNMAHAAAAQACGAACIEAYCDILQEKIRDEASKNGRQLYLRPRFSPGYGDLPLQCQRSIFDELECAKRIGLTLTDSMLMYPTKSVTAFIGLTANLQGCHINRCGNCDKIDCGFRGEA